MEKSELMAQLKSESRELLEACDPDVNMVWGEGNLDADLVLIGEAPGGEEDKRGHPFVGAAGRLLDSELAQAGIPREIIYITNVVKCRPIHTDDGRITNRPPTGKEIKTWSEALARELEIVSPRLILCLGAVAASVIIHPGFAMTSERGDWFNGPLNTRAMATFHPSYILRAKSARDITTINAFKQDLAAIASAMK
ncbi:MAG: uracil-DNA glycosylase [Armatimonadota bacterium]|nr:uracil-DNA glycosylase [bacterium]